jgi:hypothetical protein
VLSHEGILALQGGEDVKAHRSDPLPIEYDIQNDVTYHEIEWLDEYRRLFTSPLE